VTITAGADDGTWEYTFDPASSLLPVFRFYNGDTGAHFYTASIEERDHVLATWAQFAYEGAVFYVARTGTPGTIRSIASTTCRRRALLYRVDRRA